jgi:hypothetical protein
LVVLAVVICGLARAPRRPVTPGGTPASRSCKDVFAEPSFTVPVSQWACDARTQPESRRSTQWIHRWKRQAPEPPLPNWLEQRHGPRRGHSTWHQETYRRLTELVARTSFGRELSDIEAEHGQTFGVPGSEPDPKGRQRLTIAYVVRVPRCLRAVASTAASPFRAVAGPHTSGAGPRLRRAAAAPRRRLFPARRVSRFPHRRDCERL